MKNIIKKINNDKRLLIIGLLIIGLFLIIVSNFSYNEVNKKDEDSFSDNQYTKELETQLVDIITSIDGAGSCKVMISIISSSETIYAKENKKSYDSGENIRATQSEDSVLTMKDSNGNEHVVITKQIMPEIGGVTVVCKGGNNIKVKSDIIEAVSTVLGISTNKVCVIAKAN